MDIGNVTMKQVFDDLKIFWGDKDPWVRKSIMVVYNGMTEIKHWRFSSAYCKH